MPLLAALEVRDMTQVAKFLSKLRIDNDQRLGEMAARLGVSPATLSSIQNGSRSVTQKFRENLYREYSLTEEQKEEFENAVQQLKGEVVISLKDVRSRNCMRQYVDTAVMFAHDLSRLDGEQLRQMQELLKGFRNSVEAQGGADGKCT